MLRFCESCVRIREQNHNTLIDDIFYTKRWK